MINLCNATTILKRGKSIDSRHYQKQSTTLSNVCNFFSAPQLLVWPSFAKFKTGRWISRLLVDCKIPKPPKTFTFPSPKSIMTELHKPIANASQLKSSVPHESFQTQPLPQYFFLYSKSTIAMHLKSTVDNTTKKNSKKTKQCSPAEICEKICAPNLLGHPSLQSSEPEDELRHLPANCKTPERLSTFPNPRIMNFFLDQPQSSPKCKHTPWKRLNLTPLSTIFPSAFIANQLMQCNQNQKSTQQKKYKNKFWGLQNPK